MKLASSSHKLLGDTVGHTCHLAGTKSVVSVYSLRFIKYSPKEVSTGACHHMYFS